MKVLGTAISEPAPVGGTAWVIRSSSARQLIACIDRLQRGTALAAGVFRVRYREEEKWGHCWEPALEDSQRSR